MQKSNLLAPYFRALSLTIFILSALTAFAQSPQFSISFPAAQSSHPLDGRMLLLLSTDPSEEPRMQINDTPKSQMVFGVTVDGLKPGEPVVVDDKAFGYPIRKLSDVPPGDYYVQALLNVYETFHRADGKTIKLAPDRGEGQHWNLAPGNLYSKPVKMTLGHGGTPIKISLDQVIPPIPDQPDTKFVRHIKIQSDLLTKFWDAPCISPPSSSSPGGSMSTPIRTTR